MAISVCICATRPDTIGAAVRSIRGQTLTDWELVVVAQGQATARIATAVHDALGSREGRVVPLATRGLSRARNAAISASTGELIAMTDDDCEAAPDWLECLAAAFAGTPEVGLVGGTVRAPAKRRRTIGNIPTCTPADVVYDSAVRGHDQPEGFAWIGANFAFRRSTADTVGPFDEYLGAGTSFSSSEDLDFQYRAVEHGVTMRTVPDAVVHHTFGWRYGVRALWNHQRDYARGNAAFAAKLTLLGDPHGKWALSRSRLMVRDDWWRKRNPVAFPIALRRYRHYLAAYRECTTEFRVDSRGLLIDARSPRLEPSGTSARVTQG